MIDEIYDRQYQAGRAELHAGLDRAFAAIGKTIGGSLKMLHHLEWNAPWAVKSKNVGRA